MEEFLAEYNDVNVSALMGIGAAFAADFDPWSTLYWPEGAAANTSPDASGAATWHGGVAPGAAAAPAGGEADVDSRSTTYWPEDAAASRRTDASGAAMHGGVAPGAMPAGGKARGKGTHAASSSWQAPHSCAAGGSSSSSSNVVPWRIGQQRPRSPVRPPARASAARAPAHVERERSPRRLAKVPMPPPRPPPRPIAPAAPMAPAAPKAPRLQSERPRGGKHRNWWKIYNSFLQVGYSAEDAGQEADRACPKAASDAS